jgi:hypothetical protein
VLVRELELERVGVAQLLAEAQMVGVVDSEGDSVSDTEPVGQEEGELLREAVTVLEGVSSRTDLDGVTDTVEVRHSVGEVEAERQEVAEGVRLSVALAQLVAVRLTDWQGEEEPDEDTLAEAERVAEEQALSLGEEEAEREREGEGVRVTEVV